MILGDSLLVMTSLAEKKDLKGEEVLGSTTPEAFRPARQGHARGDPAGRAS
jgi:hypothetical protein